MKGVIFCCFFLIPNAVLCQAISARTPWYDQVLTPVTISSIQISVEKLEIVGEIDPAQLGVNSPGILYGVPGGGLASAIAMLIGHAATVKAQQNQQLSKLSEEAKLFGAPLTGGLKNLSKIDLATYAISKMPESATVKFPVAVFLQDQKLSDQWRLDFNFEVTRDYGALILNALFARQAQAELNTFKIQVSENKNPPYLDDTKKIRSDYDLVADATLLLQQALRMFYARETLEKMRAVTQKTFRSNLGGKRRYERGFLISEGCDRHLFENLAGVWVVADKAEQDSLDERCSGARRRAQ